MVVPMILMNRDLQYTRRAVMKNALAPAKKGLASLADACLCACLSVLSQPSVASGLPVIPL